MTFIPRSGFDVRRRLDPLHYWLANANEVTLNSGNVELVNDLGRGTASNLESGGATGINAPAWTAASGTNGHPAITFDGANTEYMRDATASLSAFNFLHNDTEQGTIGYVIDDTGTNNRVIYANCIANEIGQLLLMRTVANGGNSWFIRTGGGSDIFIGDNYDIATGITVHVLRKSNETLTSRPSGATHTMNEMEWFINGKLFASARYNQTPSSSNASRVFTVGAAPNGGSPWSGDLFEMFVDDRWVSDELVQEYSEYAVRRYQAVVGFE